MDRCVPTLSDVARHAGVSYATADRVVNGRGHVSAATMRRVEDAVRDLGYARNLAAANLARRRTYRFVFVLPDGDNLFFDTMQAQLDAMQTRAALLSERADLIVERVPAFDAEALADRLERMLDRDGPEIDGPEIDGPEIDGPVIDGLAVVGMAHPRVQAALERLRASGVPVVALVSDLPEGRDAYIGIDNLVAGQTAGRLIALAHRGRSGRVLPIVGGLAARDHAERLAGLRSVLAGAAPALTVCPEITGRDEPDRVEAMLRQALEAGPDITAIYSLGAGNPGLIRVLRGRQTRPVTVLHELSADSRAALADGIVDVVIDQRPEDEVARALSTLRLMANGQTLPEIAPIVPALYVKENLPPGPSGGAPTSGTVKGASA